MNSLSVLLLTSLEAPFPKSIIFPSVIHQLKANSIVGRAGGVGWGLEGIGKPFQARLQFLPLSASDLRW